jgi:hypothetical protein
MTLLTLLGFVGGLFTGANIYDGYSNRMSVLPGDSVHLYFNASHESKSQAVRLFDLNGNVAASFVMDLFPQEFPRGKAYENGFDYRKTATVLIPELRSGLYLWENTVPIIIRARHPRVVVVYSSNTENAYSPSGGKSFYDYNSDGNRRAVRLSFHRPVRITRHGEAFFRWMAKQDIPDVGYITDIDLDDYHEIKKALLLIIPGHNEYWTRRARENFDRFVHDGKNAMVLSGNTMWWQVRYSDDKTQLICYKSADEDRIRLTNLKTTRWNDPTLGYPITKSIGVDFSLAGYGLKNDLGWDGFKIVSDSPLLEGTGLRKGEILDCPSDEYDGAPLLGFDENGIPVINRQALGFEKIELVGFDLSSYAGADAVATWIVFRPTKRSGVVINTASTDWCSYNGIGNNRAIQIITMNMITKLLKKQNVFSPEERKESLPAILH